MLGKRSKVHIGNIIILLLCSTLIAIAFVVNQGNLVAKRSTFPSGIKSLADYVHAKGLKLGIYSDAGY